MASSTKNQLRTYASLRSLESRANTIDGLIRSLKRHCLNSRPGVQKELIASTAQLQRRLRQVTALATELESSLGATRGSTEPTDARADVAEQPCIRGTTSVLGVPDLVNLLSTLQKTGTLSLQADDAMFVFEFEAGKIVHAVTNQQKAELRLGTILVAQNVLTEQQLLESIHASVQAKSLLGSHLVHSATVSESDLRAALDMQVRRIFDAAFALRGAQFTFVEGCVSSIAQRTAVNTMELLLEAARQEDEERARANSGNGHTQNPLDTILRD